MDRCPICNSSKTAIKYICTDKLVSGKEFSLVECSECQFIYTSDSPLNSEIGDYYKSEDYISHSDTKKGLFNRIYHIARNRMLRQKASLIKKYSGKAEGSLLDIGCGTGYFAGFMKNIGWKVEGVESDKEAAKFASEKFGIKIYKLDDLPQSENKNYETITLWHVLEHLYEPKKLLSLFDKLLSDDGILVIALPNNESYDSKMYRQKWAAWDVPRHLWHFNIKSFREYIKDSNFELICTRKMPLDAFYVSVLSEKNYKASFALIKGFIVGLLGWFISLFRKSASSSLIYIMRKKA